VEAYIYGAGSMGEHASNILMQQGIKVKAIIDKNVKLIGKMINCVEIISLKDIPESDKENAIFAVAVVKYPFNDIRDSLYEVGCKNVVYVGDLINFVYTGPSIANTWSLTNITKEDEYKLEFAYNNYSDDNSRSAFRQAVKWLKDRVEFIEPGGMADFDSKYFIDKITDVLTDNEVFIDCGAYNGSSIAKIVKYTDSKFNQIHSFEPNKENYDELCNFIKNEKLESKVQAYNFGLGNIDGEKKFTSRLSLTSRYSDEFGDVYCKINKIDTVMKNTPYTFLKIYGIANGLDILEGGINTIKANRPIITINIHHSHYNFVNIPEFLMKNLTEYNFYLRLHGFAGSDITIYAIPKER